ncbi:MULTISPECIES: hypothetical protein [unclassified Clostridium]|uniref:hypothetical protein n=1 Tax=unclassified Clostridium TaxID=2614128 RepID=UPI00207AD289|nr:MULTISPECIES: hypothetical protein [unclassified Clostridium]
MDFENIDDFYSELQKNIGIVLKQEAEEIREVMYEYVREVIYHSYSPHSYMRTYEILDSIIIDYNMVGENEFIAEITIDTNKMQSPSNSYNKEPVPISEIIEMFAEGRGYMREGKEMDMVQAGEEYIETGKALCDILNHLKSKGYDIA